MVKLENPPQSEKAELPIVVTEFGMVSGPVKPWQYAKAKLPIVVTEFGMVRLPVKLQPSKAP